MNPIRLRQVTLDDATYIHQWKSDPLIQQMALDTSYVSSIDKQTRDIESALHSPHARYDMIEYQDKAVGYIRIDWMNDEQTYAWLRFAMGEERGKGIMKQALTQYLSELFTAGCHRVEGEVYSFNVVSQKLLEGLGFVKEGIKRKAHRLDGQSYDIYVYGLLAEEYPSG